MPQQIKEKPVDPKAANAVNILEDFYIGAAENTFYKSPFVPDSYDNPYNPDDLYKKTGDYTIYEDMLNDDQVSVCLKLKKDLVLGSGFDIVADEGSKDIKEFLEEALTDKYHCSFNDSIEEILSAYEFGFSLTEKIFKMKEDGKLYLENLKTRHPNSWLMHQDDKGNVEKYVQRGSKGDINVNPKSLIHFVNNKKFQNPYGVSDLRMAYNAWFTKRQIIRYMAIFMEKASSPTPVGKFDKNAPQAAVDKLFESLKKFQAKTALVIPKEIEVEFLEAKNNGDVYKNAINLFNMFIGRALFIPDLVGLTGTESSSGGSFALGKEQIKLFFLHIQRRREQVEKLIDYHIIKPLVYTNFGDVEKCPKFKFKPLDDSQALDSAKLWLDAVKGKTYKPNPEEIEYFRELVKFPGGPVEMHEEVKLDEMGNPIKKDPMGKEMPEDVMKEMPDDGMKEKPDKSKFAFGPKPVGDYHKKVDFKVIKAKFEDYDKSVMTESGPIVRKILNDLFDQIERKKIISSQDLSRAEGIKLKYLKELQLVFKSSFNQLYKDSQMIAQNELFKGNFRRPIPADKVLDLINDETFQYIGDWEYMIDKSMRVKLAQAIKDGESLASVLDELEDVLGEMSEVSIERFARTKHTEVFNNARLAYFEDSGVIAAYQYSAILDDRTSDICAGLDGKIFESGSEVVPPLHFNALVEGSLISIKDGYKKIEDIKIGDLVLTHKGNYKEVYDFMSKFEDKEYYEIELDNGNKINITGEHPVLTYRGWIRADHLMISDDVICLKDIKNEV